jgi:N-methylhydantoinase A
MNVTMAAAIRAISIERGVDPRGLPLICAGGAAAAHAALIARELDIRKVLVPRDAAIFCASGMLHSDLKHDLVRSHTADLDDVTSQRFAALLNGLENEAMEMLVAEEIRPEHRRLVHYLDLRYQGQYHEVTVEVPRHALGAGDTAVIAELFHRRHDRLYGYCLREENTAVEMVGLRLTALGVTDKPAFAAEPKDSPESVHAVKGQRPIYMFDRGTFDAVTVYDGDRLRHGNVIAGPAIVEKVTTTIVVPTGFLLSIDAWGTAVLEERS